MSKVSKQDDLYIMRHSLAHIMAMAIQDLHPEARFGVGPVVENGFYYDIELKKTISSGDLDQVEAKMREVIKADYPFVRKEVSIDDAISFFSEKKQQYKVELLKDLQKFGTTSAKDIADAQLGVDENVERPTTVSLYTDGLFTDLCRGPHVESTGKVGVFKLMKVAGAYWRGNEKNAQMQRVYGVAFETKNELRAYLAGVEEAKKRDHRKLGQELDLFTFSDLVGAGLPMYTPKGTIIIEQIKGALKEISTRHGMLMVSTPHIAKIDLYNISGHAAKFEQELFKVQSHYKQEFVLKPVSCPHHTQIYASRPRSYRDLPLRYIEQAMQYRDEKPGQLGGLQRTRGFTLDDGHTFCRVDQIETEAGAIAEIIREFYEGLGLWGRHWVSLSLRDPNTPDAYIGELSDWNEAEKMLAAVSDKYELGAKPMVGEAAIYGPKLDFMFQDALGRETQLATIQLDFAMPKRFSLEYIDQDGTAKAPVMIHRAILGSFERFLMLLIEHFAGNFPLWLAPEQVRLITVNDSGPVIDRTFKMLDALRAAGIRVELDNSVESVGKKIRTSSMAKVPYTIVIGEKEALSPEVTPRVRADMITEQPVALSLDSFIDKLTTEVQNHELKSSL